MRLRTFGGLWVETDRPLSSLGPRRLALLALVAAAGKRGVSRERVVGFLWGDSGEEQARHTLSQNLYTLKRESGVEWVTGTAELRLAPGVSSDVGDLLDALERNDLERVAELYTRPFLDGFYLPGAPGFERWVDEERARLQAKALHAIESLALEAGKKGRASDAIRWWRRLVEFDPLSAAYAAGLMRELASGGDQSAALAHFRAHREVVRRELETDVDAALAELAATLKTSVRARPAPASIPAVSSPPAVTAVETKPRNPAVVRLMIAALGAVIVAALAWLGASGSRESEERLLAVGSIRSADSALPSSVLRDMLATSLGSIRGLRVVSNSRLLELLVSVKDTLPGAVADAARRAGATEIVEGEVTPAGGRVRLSLRRVELGSGIVRNGYSVSAATSLELIDRAAAEIASDLGLGSPALGVATIRTRSPVAYALYLEGLRAYYQGDVQGTYRLMRSALEHDSTFAMAAYYGWMASRPIPNLGPVGDPALLSLAKTLASRSIDRERLLIQATVAALEAPASQALAIAETLAVRYPTDPDGQIQLGISHFNSGGWAEAVAAYNRAVSLDSAAGTASASFCRICAALSQASVAYVWSDSAEAAVREARRVIALRPNEPIAWAVMVEPLLRLGRRAEAERHQARRDSVAGRTDPAASGFFRRDHIRWGRLEQLDRELDADLAGPVAETKAEARWLKLFSLRNQGRLQEASALAQGGGGLEADSLMLAVLAWERGRPREAAAFFHQQAAGLKGSDLAPGHKARIGSWLLTLAGTAYREAGDTAVVRRLADSVMVLGELSYFGRDARLHHFLEGFLFQLEGRHAEAVEAYRRSLFSLTDGYTRTNLELATCLLALNRADEAIAVLRPALRGGVDGSNTYVTHTVLHEALAQAFEQAGQRDSAVAHYRMVEAAWRNADPQFEERYRRAKERSGANLM